MVERKGLGHPDTICDHLADAVERALARFYLDRFGAVLHHNVDKMLLVAGSSRPAFGGGEVDEPVDLILAGRATVDVRGVRVPVEEIAVETCRAWIRQHLRYLDPDGHVRLHCRIRPGSAELVDLFTQQARTGVWLSNDTSSGVGFAPRTPTERLVLETERRLGDLRAGERPEIGEDVKLMAVRRGGSVDLTVAAAFVGRHLRDLDAYRDARERLGQLAGHFASEVSGLDVRARVNTADDLDRGAIYLTVTGTSAEAGDDGQVGRGNRASGLITPYRPMTMEAVAGKNPVSHVGKIYNVAAELLAADVVARVDGVVAAEVQLVSSIGRPVREPQLLHVRVHTEPGVDPVALRQPVEDLARAHMAETPDLAERLIRGEIPVC